MCSSDLLQLKMIKQMGEAVDNVKDGITMSAGLSSSIHERSTEMQATLMHMHQKSKDTQLRIKVFRDNQRKVRKTIKKVHKLIKEQHVHSEVKKYKTIDFFLSSQVYLTVWFIYILANFCLRGGIFERHKADLFRHLILATVASIALDYGNLTLNLVWLSTSTLKARLLLKAINLVYFLNGIKSVIGSKAELHRLETLMQVKADCEKLMKLRQTYSG